MVKRTGPTNPYLEELIHDLKRQKKPLWKILARELSKSRRTRCQVNLGRINRYAKKGEVIVVPGKVMGSGDAPEKTVIAAWAFTASAQEKIKKAKGKALSIKELVKAKHKKIRIMK
jgi:large subunit ribosomal protein L18e